MSRRCGEYGHKSGNGTPCRAWPVKGATVCVTHGGAAPQVAAKAAVRAEVQAWGLDQPQVDHAQVLGALVAMAAGRVRLVSAQLQAQFEAYAERGEDLADDDGMVAMPGGIRALIGYKYGLTKDGDRLPVEEATRGLAAYEAEWTDRLGRLCKLAIDAGLEERRLQVEEQQAAMVAQVLSAALAEVGLGERSDEVLRVVARRLEAVA
jgi:hypothetical protein